MKIKNGFKSVLLSVFLIAVLLLGSDSAFAVAMYISDVVVDGQELSFSVDIDINENERLPISFVAVVITNSTGVLEDNNSWVSACVFFINGTMLNSEDLCSNFNVTPINTRMNFLNTSGYGNGSYYLGYGYAGYYNASYDYGYGYYSGYDYNTSLGSEFKYNVTWMAPNENADYKLFSVVVTDEGSMLTISEVYQSFSIVKTTPAEESFNHYFPRASSNMTSNDTEIIDQTLGDLKDFIGSGVSNYTVVSDSSLTQTLSLIGENITQMFASFGEDVVSAIMNALGTNELVDVTVTTNVRVVQVTMADGSVANYTMIERTFNNLGNITVIEVVPKSVASSAALISGEFTILLDDPVLEFNLAPNGKVSYLINGIVSAELIETLSSKTVAAADDTLITALISGSDTAAESMKVFGIIFIIIAIAAAIFLLIVKFKVK